MANKTTNYGLIKPLPEEFYDIAVHNENMDKIDTELKNKAPSGFGLGTTATLISNTDLLDTLKLGRSGWYRGTNVTNAPVSGWC